MGKPVSLINRTILFWLFWMVLTADYSLFNLLLGSIVSIFLVLISLHLFETWSAPIPETVFFPFRLVAYSLAMIYLIIKANIDVATRVLDPDLPINPAIIEYKTKLKSDLAKTIFANSITLTPGTLTVDIEKDILYVHCLAEAHQIDLLSGQLENLVVKLMKES